MSVTICGIVGLIGLIFFMPNTKTHSIEDTTHPFKALTQIFNPVLLFGALITVLGYTGAFTLYTYISPLLLDITKVSIQTASSMMLIYGICAAVGNILGGKLSDKLGVDKAVAWIMFLLTLSLVGINFYGMNTTIMCILIGAMGAISYAAVPAMQARVISIAHTYVPRAVPVASGLNIAGFNSGIALGSLLGGFIITSVGVRYLAIGGASISFIGLSILIFSTLSKRQPSHSQ
jgi:DHA1 family inner membrane transport protein